MLLWFHWILFVRFYCFENIILSKIYEIKYHDYFDEICWIFTIYFIKSNLFAFLNGCFMILIFLIFMNLSKCFYFDETKSINYYFWIVKVFLDFIFHFHFLLILSKMQIIFLFLQNLYYNLNYLFHQSFQMWPFSHANFLLAYKEDINLVRNFIKLSFGCSKLLIRQDFLS